MGASSPGEDLSWTPPSPGGSSEHTLQKQARTDGFSRHLQMQTSTLSVQHCLPFLRGHKGRIRADGQERNMDSNAEQRLKYAMTRMKKRPCIHQWTDMMTRDSKI